LRRTSLPLSFAVAILLGACASSGATQKSSGSPDKLTSVQIMESNATSAFDVVSQLRPNWLRPPGLTMTGMQNAQYAQVMVYLDNQRMGGPEALKSITAASVASMQFLDPTRAASVVRDMGSGQAASSVIMVTSK
jgi:hypothetical protein